MSGAAATLAETCASSCYCCRAAPCYCRYPASVTYTYSVEATGGGRGETGL
jgi:hypothetical protein